MQIVLQKTVKICLKKTLSIFVIGLFVLIPVNSSAASFDFNPSSNQFLAGCKSTLDIMANATGKSSNAADIELYYNPNEIEIADSLPNTPGTQIRLGDAYETYFGNDINVTTGRIRLAGASFVSNLNSRKVFASVDFTSKPGVIATSFNIKFDGVNATLDSNIAESSTSDDLLSSVTNGKYTFKTGDCTSDKIPPVITFQTPPKYGLNIPLDQNVIIKITDNQSGVDLSKTTIDINGDTYTLTSPEVSHTGSILGYTITINPKNNFINGEASVIRVQTSDLAGNKNSDTSIFNIPTSIIKEKLCPEADQQASNPATNNSGNSNSGAANSNSNQVVAQNTQNNTANAGPIGFGNGSGSDNSSTNSISNLALSTLVLARTGGSLKDILLYNYWWGIPLLILLLVLISKRSSCLKKKTKLN